MSLLVTFLSVAALFLLRHAEFISIVQFFVYGGGIMVLFLFVIMLVNLHRLQEVRHLRRPAADRRSCWRCSSPPCSVGSTPASPSQITDTASAALRQVEGELLGNSEAVAWLLYREYLLPFEVASVFLLVAMIGAVVLGRRH